MSYKTPHERKFGKKHLNNPKADVIGKGPVKSGETYGQHLDAVAAKRTAAAKAIADEKRARRQKIIAAASDAVGVMQDANDKANSGLGKISATDNPSSNGKRPSVLSKDDIYRTNAPDYLS